MDNAPPNAHGADSGRAFAERFLAAVVTQAADSLRGMFEANATVYWHNTGESFTVNEYVRANCEYPGLWHGAVERVEAGPPLIVVAKVWSGRDAFRVVSFIEFSGGKIARLDEYWGDVAPPPEWRRDMLTGNSIVIE